MKASHKAVESKLASFSKEVEEAHEEVIGSLLFMCFGRTPDSVAYHPKPHLHSASQVEEDGESDDDELDDVRAFHKYFPNTPITGFYTRRGVIGSSSSLFNSHKNDERGAAAEADDNNTNSGGGGGGGGGGGCMGSVQIHTHALGKEIMIRDDVFDTRRFDIVLMQFTALFGMFLQPRKKKERTYKKGVGSLKY
jgi:hypothetical protein